MCRNIKTLHNFEPPATDEEVHAASLQFVRKLSGFTKPSRANEAIFLQAVDDVARVAPHAAGVIVGSALIEAIERGEDPSVLLRAMKAAASRARAAT